MLLDSQSLCIEMQFWNPASGMRAYGHHVNAWIILHEVTCEPRQQVCSFPPLHRAYKKKQCVLPAQSEVLHQCSLAMPRSTTFSLGIRNSFTTTALESEIPKSSTKVLFTDSDAAMTRSACRASANESWLARKHLQYSVKLVTCNTNGIDGKMRLYCSKQRQ